MKFHLHFIRLQYDEASRPVINVDILFFQSSWKAIASHARTLNDALIWVSMPINRLVEESCI
jgi:hypothetical protein